VGSVGKNGGEIDEAGPAARGDEEESAVAVTRMGARQGEPRSGSLCWPVISKTVNRFIALGPIPGWPGAASCRPPRSWRLGRRSGRVPAWPDPPPRSLEHTPNYGHPAIHSGIDPARTRAEECPGNCEARGGSSTRTLIAREMAGEAMCGRMCHIIILTQNYIYI
jgi:hypothetical protein